MIVSTNFHFSYYSRLVVVYQLQLTWFFNKQGIAKHILELVQVLLLQVIQLNMNQSIIKNWSNGFSYS